jgi:hypothetical protein
MRNANNQVKALKLMQKPDGANVQTIAKVLRLENTKQARGLIDRLRDKLATEKDPERGLKLIKNVGHGTFKASARLNPKS